MSKTNAERFINAYNEIDYSLRTIYGFKRNITFSDAIRKAVTLNSVVRKYEETLIDYGRLRNSIVHKSNPNYIIAEPHTEVVEDLEKIAKLISTPPTALQQICKKNVITERADTSIKTMMGIFADLGFQNIPIYDTTRLIGVINGSGLVRHLGQQVKKDIDLDEYMAKTPIRKVFENESEVKYFKVADKTLTIEKALNLFYIDRKLTCILITEKGNYNEKPLGIITLADIMDMNAVLENYSGNDK